VVVGNQTQEARSVIDKAGHERSAQVIYAHERVSVVRGPTQAISETGSPIQQLTLQGPLVKYRLTLPVLGPHQVDNAITAITALEVFSKKNGVPIDAKITADGVAAVYWPGRAEVLTNPDDHVQIIVDGAHNSASAAAFVSTIESLFPSITQPILIYAGSGGHDFAATAREFSRLLPKVIVTRTRHPKAVPAEIVAKALQRDNVPVAAITTDVESALREASRMAVSGSVIVATGSLFVAAEIRETVLSIQPEIYPDMRGGVMPFYEVPHTGTSSQSRPSNTIPESS